MATSEEMIVVAIYLWTGLKTASLPEEMQRESRSKKRMYRAGRGDFGSGKAGVLSIVFAFMNMLFDKLRQGDNSPNGSTKETTRQDETV